MESLLEEQSFIYEVKKVQWIGRLLNYWTITKYYLQFDVRAWEIYEIDYGINVGHEFSGRHYGVVIRDSPYYNPIITVIPIKTSKGKMNPSSDVYLGKIEGIQSLKNSIAVINQIQSIDKLRIFNVDSINQRTITNQLKLTNQQINIVKNAIKMLLFNF